MRADLAAATIALATTFTAPALAQSVVGLVDKVDVLARMTELRLGAVEDRTADLNFPSLGIALPDRRVLQTTLFACRAEGCAGVKILVTIKAPSAAAAGEMAQRLDAVGVGFDAWAPENAPAVILDTYLVLDGGVSDSLISQTMLDLLSKSSDVLAELKALETEPAPGR